MFIFSLPTRLFDVAGSEAGGSGSGPVSTPSTGSTPSTTGTSQPAASTPASDGTQSASSTGTQQPTTTQQPADDLQDGNWRELRTRYDAQKAEIAQLKSQSSPAAAQVITHAQSMAKTLGYSDQDFNEAFTKDPIKTLQILQEESAASQSQQGRQGGQPDLNKQLEEMVNAKLNPIQEFQNRQATEVAMTKYESTLTGLMQADPILKDAPTEIVDLVKDYLGEYFSTQPEILMAMKTKHDFSAVQDSLKFVSGRLHAGFKAWLAKSPNSGVSTNNQQPARTGAKLTLDQIIDDPGVLGTQYRG